MIGTCFNYDFKKFLSSSQIIHCVSTHKIRIKLGGDQTKSSHVESPGRLVSSWIGWKMPQPWAPGTNISHPLGQFFLMSFEFPFPIGGIFMYGYLSFLEGIMFIHFPIIFSCPSSTWSWHPHIPPKQIGLEARLPCSTNVITTSITCSHMAWYRWKHNFALPWMNHDESPESPLKAFWTRNVLNYPPWKKLTWLAGKSPFSPASHVSFQGGTSLSSPCLCRLWARASACTSARPC